MAARVYVIELSAEAGKRRDPRIPWVYVGSSAREPELRFSQHLRGYKSGRLAKRYGVRLRPDLFDDLAPLPGSRRAREAEVARARELATCGFIAHCDGVSHGLRDGAWKEWDAARLGPVLGHLDAAILELTASAFEPLAPRECARLLYGERGFWVADYLDPLDPPPAYGLFPHVAADVLEDRVRELRRADAVARPAGTPDRAPWM